jgi:hypothetical protein
MYSLCAFFAFVVFCSSNVLDVIVRGDPAGRHEICGKIGGVASPGPGVLRRQTQGCCVARPRGVAGRKAIECQGPVASVSNRGHLPGPTPCRICSVNALNVSRATLCAPQRGVRRNNVRRRGETRTCLASPTPLIRLPRLMLVFNFIQGAIRHSAYWGSPAGFPNTKSEFA